jgi:dihydroorotate dehydrogenase
MYSFIKKLLFQLDPEQSHHLAMQSVKLCYQLGLTRFLPHPESTPLTLMGLSFPNRVGLAAGLDKNGDYVDALGALGFGFIEIGTITPRPQEGNPKPRLFRLTEQKAIINRMGFNNKGMEYVAKKLEKMRYRGILGINLGKNKDTPLEQAADDYLLGFRTLWKFASYITVNISSPNTPGLRDLQQMDLLTHLLSALKQEQQSILTTYKRYIPLVVKISPDLSAQALQETAAVLLQQKIDGVIATNTTLDRSTIKNSPFAKEAGGLSGQPLSARSTEVISQLHAILQDNIPIIASGGVMDEKTAAEKLKAGARLLQVYTGFIYAGPGMIRRLRRVT